MSRNAIYSARFDFTIANYLSHIMQNEAWEKDAANT